MVNTLAVFALTAVVCIGAIIGMLLGMSWVEKRMVGGGKVRRKPRPAPTRHRQAPQNHQFPAGAECRGVLGERASRGVRRRVIARRTITEYGSRRSRTRVTPRS